MESNNNIQVVGVDLSKNVMHMVGINHTGRIVHRVKATREEFMTEVRKLPKGTKICMEACGGAHYWSRECNAAGYETRQLHARHVKGYLKGVKNDYRDSEAVAEAGSREHVNTVPLKSHEQLLIQGIHRVRERQIRNRTALINQLRGFLLEHGVAIAKSVKAVKKYLSDKYGTDKRLTEETKQLIDHLVNELAICHKNTLELEATLKRLAKSNDYIIRLDTIPGIGIIGSTCIYAVFGNASTYNHCRELSAVVGVVPHQNSTGGETLLGHMKRRGNRYLRSILIQGARVAIRAAVKKKAQDQHSLWMQQLFARKGMNLAAIAVANKNLRIAYKILRTPEMVFKSVIMQIPDEAASEP